jgi:hypothetical protein
MPDRFSGGPINIASGYRLGSLRLDMVATPPFFLHKAAVAQIRRGLLVHYALFNSASTTFGCTNFTGQYIELCCLFHCLSPFG